ncbi:MAG: methyltransferase domain-containing protein [Candidatus Eremiobacteraeota bacterium]|nr:methyltransferase domain-containing protein [Candidatus Eremiobacteraeota bacterium]
MTMVQNPSPLSLFLRRLPGTVKEHLASSGPGGGKKILLLTSLVDIQPGSMTGRRLYNAWKGEISSLLPDKEPGGDEIPAGSADFHELEERPFPWKTGSLDCIAAESILEHFRKSPTCFLNECHRVLRSRGVLYIATRRAFSKDALAGLLSGKNCFPPLCALGTGVRITRKFTSREIEELLRACGFDEIKEIPPSPGSPGEKAFSLETVRDLATLLGVAPGACENLHESLIMACRKGPGSHYSFPPGLYRHKYLDAASYRSEVVMGDNCALQIAGGWYPLEKGPPAGRWTGKTAALYLKRSGSESVLALECHLPSPDGEVFLPLAEMEGAELPFTGRKTGDLQILRCWCPRGGEGLVKVTLHAGRIFRPSDHGSRDTRELGLYVRRIALSPGHTLLMGMNDDILAGEGWHELERHAMSEETLTYRWTAGEARGELLARGGEKAVSLHYYFPSQEGSRAFLEIADPPMGAIPLPPAWEWEKRTLALPGALEGRVIFILRVTEPWVPAHADSSGDTRELGIAVSSLSLAYGHE